MLGRHVSDAQRRGSQQWISELGRSVGLLMLPATLKPEVLLRRAAHPALQYGSVVGDDAIDVGVLVARLHDGDLFEADRKSTVRLSQRRDEDHRRTESPRKDSRTAR